MTGYTPTERELEVLRALVDEGTYAKAAHVLGCAEQTVKNSLYVFRERAGVEGNARLVYEYHDELVSF